MEPIKNGSETMQVHTRPNYDRYTFSGPAVDTAVSQNVYVPGGRNHGVSRPSHGRRYGSGLLPSSATKSPAAYNFETMEDGAPQRPNYVAREVRTKKPSQQDPLSGNPSCCRCNQDCREIRPERLLEGVLLIQCSKGAYPTLVAVNSVVTGKLNKAWEAWWGYHRCCVPHHKRHVEKRVVDGFHVSGSLEHLPWRFYFSLPNQPSLSDIKKLFGQLIYRTPMETSVSALVVGKTR
jgi:hypothetical protein